MKFSTAMAKQQLTVAYLKDMAVVELGDRSDGALALTTLMLYLTTLSREDAFISMALTQLMNEGKVTLGHVDRVVRLVEES